jgi:hypothetical protein
MLRLSRGPRDSRSTDDSTQEEPEKDAKKSKHRTRTSSRNSPLVSPTVVCDMSEGSPTKIKIINVSHLSTESKGTKSVSEEVSEPKSENILEISQASDTLDIALPTEDSQTIESEINKSEVIEEKIEELVEDKETKDSPKPEVSEESEPVEKKEESSRKSPPSKSASPSPRYWSAPLTT